MNSSISRRQSLLLVTVTVWALLSEVMRHPGGMLIMFCVNGSLFAEPSATCVL